MLAHAVYTGAFGAALGFATWQRSAIERISVAAIGLTAAVVMHATHNGLLASGRTTAARGADYAFVVIFLACVAGWLLHQRAILQTMLVAERDDGILTEGQWRHVHSPVLTARRHAGLLWRGEADQVRVERELNRELVELAFARWRDKRLARPRTADSADERRRRIRELQDLLAVAQESAAA
jgi:protein-S-isoprenylcysteine O-methyltransferase Ste14